MSLGLAWSPASSTRQLEVGANWQERRSHVTLFSSFKSWQAVPNARATIHIARARNCRHLDSRTIPPVPIDDTIENDPRRNRNQSIEIRKLPIWYVAIQYRHPGRRQTRGGSAAAHDSKLFASPSPPRRRHRTHAPRTPPTNAASLQVLAVDLLNPSPQHEARQHKLKVYTYPSTAKSPP